ncbi:hypothetical protein J3R30DRAFT_3483716 [Lentinula aciculospora]|uniref:RecQ-mediated genome instability protein 1 n=1 Tax=Lentinula aciculospora TaxID=153920 RepID=A0A9W9A8Y8_9AGAR|nr:hypothetical protein J3R30DRAFT_3483716 [Lentinula aciculospora]
MPPEAITSWLKRHYPKPQIDPEWLQACYDWIISDKNMNPAADMQKIIEEVEVQLLESDLRDSMLHGTGIPNDITNINAAHSKLTGPPVLVQIEAITDVGVSAYSLNKTRIIRQERRIAGEEQEGEADGEVEGEGPIPNYSRSMLRLELSDGATTLRATEYRPIPELTLGGTPLGYKLQIQNAEVRRGIIFLEPRNIKMKGHMISDREVNQEADLAQGLRRRLGLPEPVVDTVRQSAYPQNPLPAVPNAQDIRPPLREISPHPLPTLLGSAHPHSDDEDQPRRRRVPNSSASITTASTGNAASHNPVISSSLFNDTVSDRRASSSVKAVHRALPLSPAVREPTIIESDDEGENVSWEIKTRPIKPIPARARPSTSSTRRPFPPGGKGKGKATESDYDDDMFEELPSSFYDEIDKVELAVGMKSLSTSSTLPVATIGPSSNSMSNPPASFSVVHSEVITVEDDDEDDKENVPAPTRHVRQRRGVTMNAPDDILELSDSD